MLQPFKKLGWLLVVVLLVSACEIELKRGLSENNADRILVALKERGIDAKKKMEIANRETVYSIITSRAKVDEARRILVVLGLPRDEVAGIHEICGKNDALIPSPSIDRCKYQLAMQNEIVKALLTIDGVVEAKVNINIPEDKILSSSDKPVRPTAAVLIKYLPEVSGKQPFDEKQLREFVANSVDNLDYNDVSIMATLSKSIEIPNLDGVVVRERSAKDKSSGLKADSKEDSNPEPEESIEKASVSPLAADPERNSIKQYKLVILFGAVTMLVLATSMVFAVIHSKKAKAEQERLQRQQRRMRLQSQNLLPSNVSGVTVNPVVTEADDLNYSQPPPPYGVN